MTYEECNFQSTKDDQETPHGRTIWFLYCQVRKAIANTEHYYKVNDLLKKVTNSLTHLLTHWPSDLMTDWLIHWLMDGWTVDCILQFTCHSTNDDKKGKNSVTQTGYCFSGICILMSYNDFMVTGTLSCVCSLYFSFISERKHDCLWQMNKKPKVKCRSIF